MALTKIQSLGITDGTIVNADINASAAIAGTKLSGAGKVLQVVSTTKVTVFSTSSTSYIDVTGLSVSITPSSASNKILVIVTSNFSGSSDDCLMQLLRDSTAIGNGTSGTVRNGFSMLATAASVNSIITASINFLDSPSTTSATTYKIQTIVLGGTVYVNRRAGNDSFGGSSTITVMEIAA
jgi:hypothetical protein